MPCVCSNASRRLVSAAIQTDGKPLTRAPVELRRCFCSFSLLSLSLSLSFSLLGIPVALCFYLPVVCYLRFVGRSPGTRGHFKGISTIFDLNSRRPGPGENYDASPCRREKITGADVSRFSSRGKSTDTRGWPERRLTYQLE